MHSRWCCESLLQVMPTSAPSNSQTPPTTAVLPHRRLCMACFLECAKRKDPWVVGLTRPAPSATTQDPPSKPSGADIDLTANASASATEGLGRGRGPAAAASSARGTKMAGSGGKRGRGGRGGGGRGEANSSYAKAWQEAEEAATGPAVVLVVQCVQVQEWEARVQVSIIGSQCLQCLPVPTWTQLTHTQCQTSSTIGDVLNDVPSCACPGVRQFVINPFATLLQVPWTLHPPAVISCVSHPFLPSGPSTLTHTLPLSDRCDLAGLHRLQTCCIVTTIISWYHDVIIP